MSWSPVQAFFQNTEFNSSGGVDTTSTLGASVAVGDLILLETTVGVDPATRAPTVVDQLGNTYVHGGSENLSSNRQGYDYWSCIVTHAGTPAIKYTPNLLIGDQWIAIKGDHFTGSDASSTVRDSKGATQITPGTTTNVITTPSVAAQSGDLLWCGGAMQNPDVSMVAGTGFASIAAIDASTGMLTEWKTASGAGAATFTDATNGNSRNFATFAFAITPAGGGGGGSIIRAAIRLIHKKIDPKRAAIKQPKKRHTVQLKNAGTTPVVTGYRRPTIFLIRDRIDPSRSIGNRQPRKRHVLSTKTKGTVTGYRRPTIFLIHKKNDPKRSQVTVQPKRRHVSFFKSIGITLITIGYRRPTIFMIHKKPTKIKVGVAPRHVMTLGALLVFTGNALVRIFSDTIQGSESTLKPVSRVRAFANTIQGSEGRLRIAALVRAFANTLQGSENTKKPVSRVRIFGNTIQGSELLLRCKTWVARVFNNTLQGSEGTVRILSRLYVVIVNSVIQGSEAKLRFLSMIRASNSSANISEGTKRPASFVRPRADTLRGTETTARYGMWVRIFNNTLRGLEFLFSFKFGGVSIVKSPRTVSIPKNASQVDLP